MKKEWMPKERRPKAREPEQVEGKEEPRAREGAAGPGALANLHHHIGNQAVQRLLAQRSGEAEPVEDHTAARINRARGDGQPLDASLQTEMGEALGHDMGGVRVHTSREADSLSEELGAKAFTTGKDVFFRQGAYDPGSSAGRELIAHELTHVVQQGTGQVHGGTGMTVNAPGDRHERQADVSARAVTTGGVQRQEEREEDVQAQDEEEEVQPQAEDEGEEIVMTQAEEEEELPVQEARDVQRQAEEEEELPVQALRDVQRQEELPEELP